KFDVIIGNPPYQIEDEGHGRSAGPVFDAFVEQAMKMNPSYLSMIVPARWYSGGKGLNSFRRMMLSDKRIREIHDFPDYRDVFPLSIQLKGGVCYFLWDRDNVGDCKVTSYHAGRVVSVLDRPLLDFGLDTFIRYNEAISIVRKVQAFSEESIMDLVSPRKPFGLPTNFSGLGRPTKSTLKVYQHGGIGYIDRSEIQQNTDVIDKYKVFIPPLGSGSDGFPHPILGRPFLGEPGSICTETYLFIGPFDNSLVPRNLITYISTRFFRFLVLLNKPTQHATRKVYQLVPKQDFSEPWTDEKLYAKYDITPEEVAFIESMVRPMDLE
ncbi:MAG: restriction endonuclease, partial [Bacteroidales bacterium]|nr:restriction endonuclease [Bacteroidales bacterium]